MSSQRVFAFVVWVNIAKSPFLGVVPAYTSLAMGEGACFTTFSAIDYVTIFLEFTSLLGRKWYLNIVLIYISIIMTEVAHLSHDYKCHLFLWIVALFDSHGFRGTLSVLGK